MKSPLYQHLRRLPWPQLWNEEVPRFDKASPAQRIEQVGLVRAVGVVFSESGDPSQKDDVKKWLVNLLHDPSEKIRRYALTALPKIGAGPEEEARVLELFGTATEERERKFAGKALEKIGGAATLEAINAANSGSLPLVQQKVQAGLARRQDPSALCFDAVLADFSDLKIHLRSRRGLEGIVRDEVEEFLKTRAAFRAEGMSDGLVSLTPTSPFSLGQIYSLRCFGTVGFVPADGHASHQTDPYANLAASIATPASQRVLRAFTKGTIRYRLNFAGKGHQRAAVRTLSNKVYALCPGILNDPRNVTWTVDIYPGPHGDFVELRPNATPDPRFLYRKRDVPASSHPQVAACMARLAGKVENEIVWDPFCGSGMELVERCLLGSVRAVYGTDISGEAVDIARQNFAAAKIKEVNASFIRSDFRDYAARHLKPKSLSLIITNPPLGMRVPVANLRKLLTDLFNIAGKLLRPGGRLVLAHPTSLENVTKSLRLESRTVVDFGGFGCGVERYVKL